ncbi:MAG TPA: glycoside hydrolase family 15 protein [Chloroflexota bacterium]|nr:glycoside hydrolase family 15 protein [Chloroflexota bacterium]
MATGQCPPIADYAVIGNCHTAALVAKDGSIDWFPPERFDAPPVFCRLLDFQKGGFLRIAPAGPYQSTRSYRGRTAVLETTFSTERGSARVIDFMPVHQRQPQREGYDVGTSHEIVRCIEGVQGEVELEVRYKPTFDYARTVPRITVIPGAGVIAAAEQQYLVLAGPEIPFEPPADGELVGRLTARAGERRWLILSFAPDEKSARAALAAEGREAELAETIAYWEEWAGRCAYRGLYRDAVVRSAITLKLLTYEPTGAIIAAPTTSLPEVIGGTRNWDYCYTWLRDSSLILYSLLIVGYDAEAADFFHWLEAIGDCQAGRKPAIAYAIDGSLVPPERVLEHLAGYRDSKPVRVGNAAAGQTQLDIYGEVLSAADQYIRLQNGSAAPRLWPVLAPLVGLAAREWTNPDEGIWEVRGGARHFLYSKLMCWVALDRGVRLAEDYHLPAPLDEWRSIREKVRESILTNGFNANAGAFTQCYGSTALDASALAIPRVGFLPATDPRVVATVDRIRHQLSRDGFVYRYLVDDSLPGREATFALSTFWLVDALALSGQVDEARKIFERLLSFANDVGLFSEEIDPVTRELLGNFPQGFTHLALIRSAANLAKAATHGPEHHAETEAERAPRAKAAVDRAAG